MSIQINPQESIQANVQRMMQLRIEDCRASLQHDDPHRAIHQARKQMKKIRAVLRLVRPQIGEAAYREANTYFRDAARLISDARDTAASLDTATDLLSFLKTRRERHAVAQLWRHLRAKKAAITRYRVGRDQLLVTVQETLADAERFHRSWAITIDGFAALEPGIKRIYRQCLKRQRLAYAQDDPEAFHEWRKSVKYLRYQVDTLSPLWPGMLSAWDGSSIT